MGVVLHVASGAHLAALAQAGGSGLASWAARDSLDHGRRERVLRRVAAIGIVAALLLQVVLIAAHAAEVLEAATPDVAAWVEVAVHTWVGRVLLAQSAGVLAVGLALAAGAPLSLIGAASALCIAAGALGAHAAADGGSAWLPLANVLHVALACLWFGSLPCLLVAAVAQDRCNADPLICMLRRFSRLALPGMVAIVLTGVALTVPLLGGQAGLFGSAYGALLLGKLALLAGALVCAARLRRAVAAPCRGPAPGYLRNLLRAETICALGVILLAGMLANVAPGAHAEIQWPWPVRFAPWPAWQTVQGAAWRMSLGIGLAAVALALAAFARGRPGRVVGAAVLMAAVGVGVPATMVDAYPTTFTHAPVPYDAATITSGAEVYRAQCIACHGATGRGDGPAAAGLVPPPADLTAPHLGYHTHGDLFWWISHGIGGTAMPGFAGSLDERQRWSALHFLLALSLGHQARALGPAPVPDDPWLPSIDFTLPDGSTLAGLRGQAVVVLFARTEDGLAAAGRAVDGLAADASVLLVVPHGLAGAVPANARVAADADGRIWRAWSLYRRTLTHPDFDDREPPPALLGVVVDRFGFVRARWRGDDGNVPSPSQLAASIRALADEDQIASVDQHGH